MLKKITTLSVACLLTMGVADTAYSFNLNGIIGGGNFSTARDANAQIVEPDEVKILYSTYDQFTDHRGEEKVKYTIKFRNDSDGLIIGIAAIDFRRWDGGDKIKRVPINSRISKPLKSGQEREITISLDGRRDTYGNPERIIPIFAE